MTLELSGILNWSTCERLFLWDSCNTRCTLCNNMYSHVWEKVAIFMWHKWNGGDKMHALSAKGKAVGMSMWQNILAFTGF